MKIPLPKHIKDSKGLKEYVESIIDSTSKPIKIDLPENLKPTKIKKKKEKK